MAWEIIVLAGKTYILLKNNCDMKTIVKSLALAMFVLYGCISKAEDESLDEINGGCEPFYYYYLFLNFQDASGKDLIEEIEYIGWDSEIGAEADNTGGSGAIKSDLYTLEPIYPEVYMDPVWTHHAAASNSVIPGPYDYALGFGKKDSYYYLFFYPQASNVHVLNYDKELPPADKIIYKLSCSYIFGNDEEHEIVTYWKQGEQEKHQICYLIEFEGKKFIPEISNEGFQVATLVLDR